MSLKTRMLAIVGDENTVVRYLFEKVAHTAFITLVLHAVFRVPLFTAGVCAAIGYLILAKTVDHWKNPLPRAELGAFLKDCLFDGLIICGLVPLIAATPLLTWAQLVVLWVNWVAAFLVLDNNRFGQPS